VGRDVWRGGKADLREVVGKHPLACQRVADDRHPVPPVGEVSPARAEADAPRAVAVASARRRSDRFMPPPTPFPDVPIVVARLPRSVSWRQRLEPVLPQPPANLLAILIASWYPFFAFTALTFAFCFGFNCLMYPR